MTQQQFLSGVSPSRLASSASKEATKALIEQDRWQETRSLALDWQAAGPRGDMWELLVPRIQHGRGRRNLTLHNILKLAAGLKLDPAELVRGLRAPE